MKLESGKEKWRDKGKRKRDAKKKKGQSGKIKMWTFKDGEMEQEGGEMQSKKDRREREDED